MQHTNKTDSSVQGRLIAIALLAQIPLEKRQKLANRIRERQQAAVIACHQGDRHEPSA